ncbi:MAG: helicase, partial [Nitrospirae bacterium]|nr:helicase [Nitrospirota bacterium]
PHLQVTFDSECATQNPKATFIMPIHPLVKQAAEFFKIQRKAITTLKVEDDSVSSGQYKFAIYQWRFHGIREDMAFKSIASSDIVNEHLNRLLEISIDCFNVNNDKAASDLHLWDELDGQHYKMWSEALKKHRQRTQELAEYRRESLSTSHNARIALLEEQLMQANNENIKRMRLSQIAAAKGDYARHIKDLDIAINSADITTHLIAYGVMHISGGL